MEPIIAISLFYFNSYFQSYSYNNRFSDIDFDLYEWLTKNVNRMQIDLGTFGSYGWNKEYYMHSSFPFQI